MAMTVTIQKEIAVNAGLFRWGYLNLGVYATGGVAAYASGAPVYSGRPFRLGIIDDLDVRQTAAYYFVWDKTTNKVLAYTDDGTSGVPAEVADTTDLTAIVARFEAFGSY